MVTDIDAGACILTGDSSNDTFTGARGVRGA